MYHNPLNEDYVTKHLFLCLCVSAVFCWLLNIIRTEKKPSDSLLQILLHFPLWWFVGIFPFIFVLTCSSGRPFALSQSSRHVRCGQEAGRSGETGAETRDLNFLAIFQVQHLQVSSDTWQAAGGDWPDMDMRREEIYHITSSTSSGCNSEIILMLALLRSEIPFPDH